MRIKVSDYIIQRLVEHGVKDVFMITGGGAMHLNDSVGKCKGINYICNYHEQASAIGAEGYARVSGKMAAVIVTTGPGGTNTLTGVIGQWLDSAPVIYISGQVKFETTIASCPEIGLRQLGDQEINIVDIVRPVTKYATMLTDPKGVKKALDKAIYIATHGRPGPVWIDVPMNVQGAIVEFDEMEEYDQKEDSIKFNVSDTDNKVSQVLELLKNSKRPVFLAGNGIRISGGRNIFLELLNKTGIPVVSSFLGRDIVPTDNPYFVGSVGSIGNRPGNFAVQNSDLLLSIGSRNNIRQISYNWKTYAREATKVIVDIDLSELNKPTLKADIAIHSDAKYFIERLRSGLEKTSLPDWKEWLDWNIERREIYPVLLPEYKVSDKLVHPYHFINEVSKRLNSDDIIVTGNATPSIVYYQLGTIKDGQRAIWNSGCAAMGYDLPAAIGASFGSNMAKQVICLAGDGSLQMNIQELEAMRYYNLPIKLFVLDNRGYISIRQTQESFFESRLVGCDSKTGVGCPDFKRIAEAYDLPTAVIESHDGMEEKIEAVLKTDGPIVCHVKLLPDYIFSPKSSSEKKPDGRMVSKPLEDMFPFLDREEFRKNLLIPEWNPDE